MELDLDDVAAQSDRAQRELDQLRADLDAAKRVIDSMVVAEVEPLKALLREALPYLEKTGWGMPGIDLPLRIRDALGEVKNGIR